MKAQEIQQGDILQVTFEKVKDGKGTKRNKTRRFNIEL